MWRKKSLSVKHVLRLLPTNGESRREVKEGIGGNLLYTQKEVDEAVELQVRFRELKRV